MRTCFGISIVVALASAPSAGAAEKRAFTLPDLYRLKGVEEPALAPDGKTLYFLSTRSGENQMWSMSGGEPRKRTDIPGGVGAFTLSGDGRLLALSADVWVECGADAACNKKRDDARAQSKLKAHLADRLLYRHWNEWRDAKRSHVLALDLTRPEATLRDLTPGDFDSPLFQVGGPLGFALSPDGAELAFTSNREADEASTTNADLFTAAWENPAYYQKASPSSYVTAFKTPCLVITGEKDFRVPYTQSLMFFTDLQKRGVPSRLLVFDEAGHWPAWHEMALYYAAHLDWFHRYLGGGASPWDPRGLARGAGFSDAP